MRRIHLFEFTDMAWYPQTFRRIQTNYLQFVATLNTGYKSLIPLFTKVLQQAQTTEIVDLCSGGTGPWLRLQEQLEQAGLNVTIKLADKYPNPEAVQKIVSISGKGVEYLTESVDAMNVPAYLTGMRTLFEGFHHFKPEQAQAILRDTFQKKVAIGIFEVDLKPPLGWLFLLLSPLMTIVGYFLMTPFIKPRTFAQFFWVYLLPIVPLTTSWDGIVSFLRVYSPGELREITKPFQSEVYKWEIGQLSTGTPILEFTYLMGYPIDKS